MSTIFALATPAGKSGVAVIRISGDMALTTLQQFTRIEIKPRQAHRAKLYNPFNENLIDHALVLFFPCPNSFTGEDVVEFHLHGSRAVINNMLEILSNIPGLSMAEPGEFSKRAFRNNKMDLTEAEGLADLIDAETSEQARVALRQMQGQLQNLYEKWRKSLVEIMAYAEAYIDFPEEEIPTDLVEKINKQIEVLKVGISDHVNDNNRGEKLRNGLYAIILGAPNSGKSSLINYIAKRDIAIVSDEAGTTRDLIEAHLDLQGFPVTLVDTAGLRNISHKVESEGIKRAIERAGASDIKIVLFDINKLSDLDEESLNIIDDKTIVVLSKCDQQEVDRDLKIGGISPIFISVKEEFGVDELIGKITSYAKEIISPSTDPVITRIRYRTHLKKVLEHIDRFSLDNSLELASEDLRLAAREIGKITGAIGVEDILDVIFSSFCIGK